MSMPDLPPPKNQCRRRAFTLVELLVVITIVGILIALLLAGLRIALTSAAIAQSISGIKQSGEIVMLEAIDNNNTVILHKSGDGSGMTNWQLFGMVWHALSKGANRGDIAEQVYKVACTPAWQSQANSEWEVWGGNMDDNVELGAVWEDVIVEKGATPADDRVVSGLRMARVNKPNLYPLLADSANDTGKPRARFGNTNDYKFAMRYREQGPIFFLDGSVRLVGVDDMEDYNIDVAYLFDQGNTVSNPTQVTP